MRCGCYAKAGGARPYSIRSTALFLPPLVCLGSLCVYHHHYDASLFFVPALLWGLVLARQGLPRWGAFMSAPLLAIILILPFGFAQNLASKLFGEHGIGLLKLSFPLALTAALVGSLALLFRGLRAAEPAVAPVSSGPPS